MQSGQSPRPRPPPSPRQKTSYAQMAFLDYLYSGLKWICYLALTATAGVIATLYFQQTKLIYPSAFPEGSRQQVPKPSEFGMNDYQDVVLKASDGVALKAYFIKNGASKTTLIYYHANAGNMGHRLPIAKQLMDRLGCNVFMLSYRGYGLSEGEANEKGMKLDAQA
jgi:abhydrolase domain-containing protein 13